MLEDKVCLSAYLARLRYRGGVLLWYCILRLLFASCISVEALTVCIVIGLELS